MADLVGIGPGCTGREAKLLHFDQHGSGESTSSGLDWSTFVPREEYPSSRTPWPHPILYIHLFTSINPYSTLIYIYTYTYTLFFYSCIIPRTYNSLIAGRVRKAKAELRGHAGLIGFRAQNIYKDYFGIILGLYRDYGLGCRNYIRL